MSIRETEHINAIKDDDIVVGTSNLNQPSSESDADTVSEHEVHVASLKKKKGTPMFKKNKSKQVKSPKSPLDVTYNRRIKKLETQVSLMEDIIIKCTSKVEELESKITEMQQSHNNFSQTVMDDVVKINNNIRVKSNNTTSNMEDIQAQLDTLAKKIEGWVGRIDTRLEKLDQGSNAKGKVVKDAKHSSEAGMSCPIEVPTQQHHEEREERRSNISEKISGSREVKDSSLKTTWSQTESPTKNQQEEQNVVINVECSNQYDVLGNESNKDEHNIAKK